MATYIKSSGVACEVKPDNGNKFSLARLQELVGGYIEAVPVGKGHYVICDEEGKLKNKPLNIPATVMFGRDFDPFVGDVLVCKKTEI